MKLTHVFYSILLFVAFSGCKTEAQQNQNSVEKYVKVETQKMKPSEEVLSLSYSGQLESFRNTRLSFPLPGKVTQIYVEEGDRIKTGQIIAQIDDSKFQSAYDAALASHHQAEDAYERLKKVYENGSLPEVDWQDIKTKKAQSKAALELSEQNLKDCKLLAPSSGIIGSIDIETGMNASPNLPVFDLLNMNVMYAKISVPENEINKIQKGQTATLEIGAIGKTKYEAVVEKIGVTANPISRTYEVKIRLISQPENIKPGMLCDVQIFPQNHAQVFILPINAILKDENHKSFVYTLNESNHTVWPRYVEVGRFYNNRVEIVSGLKTNDQVIISGQHKLSPNAKVNI